VGPLASVRVPFGFVMGPNTLEGEDIFNLARSKGAFCTARPAVHH
jgi:hypothetical protein